MSRELMRWGDQIATITVHISKPATTNAEIWKGIIPFAALTFDNRPDQPAKVGQILGASFGGAAGCPAGVSLSVLADTKKTSDDPRAAIRDGAYVQLSIASGTAALEDVPLTLYCLGVATDAPAAASLTIPAVTTNTSDIDVTDIDGGTLDTYWITTSRVVTVEPVHIYPQYPNCVWQDLYNSVLYGEYDAGSYEEQTSREELVAEMVALGGKHCYIFGTDSADVMEIVASIKFKVPQAYTGLHATQAVGVEYSTTDDSTDTYIHIDAYVNGVLKAFAHDLCSDDVWTWEYLPAVAFADMVAGDELTLVVTMAAKDVKVSRLAEIFVRYE